jgi:hypothetical protein
MYKTLQNSLAITEIKKVITDTLKLLSFLDNAFSSTLTLQNPGRGAKCAYKFVSYIGV